MQIADYTDPAGRFRLREIKITDTDCIEFLNEQIFLPYLRHIMGTDRFVRDALAAQGEGQRTDCWLAVAALDTDRLIGMIGSRVLRPKGASPGPGDVVEVAYCLIPQFQRRGLVRAALLAFIADRMPWDVTSLMATVDPENTPSIMLLKSLGFVQIGPEQPSIYPGDPSNPRHFRDGVLQTRPRLEFRADIRQVRLGVASA